MEEMKEHSSMDVDDEACTIVNLVSHEETVESQPISEGQIADNSALNLTETQGSEGQDRKKNITMEEPNIDTTNANVSIVQNIKLDYKKMVHLKELQLASVALQHLTRKSLEERFNDPIKEEKNIVISDAETTSTIRHNFERLAERYTRKATPADLVVSENDQITENVLEDTDSARLDKTNINPNTPYTNEETLQQNIPPVILRSVQKLFTIRQSNTYNKNVYPLNVNTYTPNVNYGQNYKVAAALSKILTGYRSTDEVPLNLKVESGTAGIPQEREQTSTSYPVSNVARKNLDYRYSLPNPQFSQLSNYNRRTGLANNGSTCYVNSVIQVLLATNKFSTLTVLGMYKYPYWSQLAELFGTMMYTVQPDVNPSKFYICLNTTNFNIFSEHDASEFLIFLFDLLKRHEPNWENDSRAPKNAPPSTATNAQDNAVAGCSYQTAEDTPSKRQNIEGFNNSEKSYIANLFGGVVATTVRCQVCSTDSNKFEKVYMLNLSFPDVIIDEVLRVQKLLNYYFTTETLTGDNRYMCGTCTYRQDALKFSIVVHNPKYLILTLKNFRYDFEKQQISKQICKVYCDRKILLPSKVTRRERSTYELYATIVHRGKSLNTGHYTAFTKCNDQWYKINDKIVKMIDESEIDRLDGYEIPYLLFYRRSDIAEGDFPEYNKIPWLSQYVQNQQNNAPRVF